MSDIKPLLPRNRWGNLHIAPPKSWPENFTVAAGLLVFFLAWTFHAAIAGADKSSHYDVLEAYAWGKEFQPGLSSARAVLGLDRGRLVSAISQHRYIF